MMSRKWRDPEDFNWFLTEMKLIFCCMQICTRMHWIALFWFYCTPDPDSVESNPQITSRDSAQHPRVSQESGQRAIGGKLLSFSGKTQAIFSIFEVASCRVDMYRFDRSCLSLSRARATFPLSWHETKIFFSLFAECIRDENVFWKSANKSLIFLPTHRGWQVGRDLSKFLFSPQFKISSCRRRILRSSFRVWIFIVLLSE